MQPYYLEARSISDAWFQLIFNIFDKSYIQQIQKGSFEGEQSRLQYAGIAVYITDPHEDIVPFIPNSLSIPAPTTMAYIEEYFANYLLNSTTCDNETYTYGSRVLFPMPRGGTQLDRVVGLLRHTPQTNQAIIEVGSPDDHDVCFGKDGKSDPPCLRLIDFKVLPLRDELVLSLSCYFRSWDLWAGFPTNLGGLELLKQYVALETGLKNGPMYAYSAGAHLYGYQEEIARLRAMRRKRTNSGESTDK